MMSIVVLVLSLVVLLLVRATDPTQLPTESPSVVSTESTTLRTIDSDGSQRRGEKPKAAAVLFVPVAERHVSAVEVTMSSSSEGAKLWYTVDGNDPVPRETGTYLYSNNEPLYIDDIGVTIIKAVATAENYDTSPIATKKYLVIDRCIEPVFDPESNETFAGRAEVTVTSATDGAVIHYTVDGSRPSMLADGSTKIVESGATVILKTFGRNEVHAMAVKAGLAPSQIKSARYYILPKVEDPVISPAQDTFPISAGLRITCSTPGASIYYTTDGSTPTRYSLEYFEEEGLTIAGAGRHTVRAYAVKQNFEDSEVATKEFLIVDRLVRPSANPLGGSYVGDVEVQIECPGAPEDTVAYYTTKASETPVEHRSNPTVKCGESLTLQAPGEYTLRAFTKAADMAISPMLQQRYSIVRPQYDSKAMDMDKNVFRVEPVVTVTSVQVPSPSVEGAGSCPVSTTTGVLARLSNVLGHFDIAVPPGGCSGSSARLGALVDISSSYLFGESTFNGADVTLIEGEKEQLEARNHARFRSLLPRDGVSPEQWGKWLVEYQETDQSCILAGGAGFYNLSSFACAGNLISSGRVVQTSAARNVNLGVRGTSFVVGYVSESEVKSTLNPFDALVAGVGWLVRNGEPYIRESITTDGEDVSPLGAIGDTVGILSQRMARSAIGYNHEGELLLVHTSETASGLTLEEFAALTVDLGFEQAINLVGAGAANLAANHSMISAPSASCGDGNERKLFKCAQPVSTATCVHALQPPINEAELEMVLGPGNGKWSPSSPISGGKPSPAPSRSPGRTAWPTFSWEKKDGGLDDDLPPPMLNGSEYSIAELREAVAFYKGSTVLATAMCAFLLSILFYMCTHKPEREDIYTVQHGMDSSHGHEGGGHSTRSPAPLGADAGIQFMQISEPQRRGPAPVGGVPAQPPVKESTQSAGEQALDMYKLSGNSGRGVTLRWQDKIGTLNLSDTSSDEDSGPAGRSLSKAKNAKSKMIGKSRHKGLGKASVGKAAEPAKVVTHSPLTPSARGAAASKYQQLRDEDDEE